MHEFNIQMLENKSSLFSHLTKWGLCPKHDNDSNQNMFKNGKPGMVLKAGVHIIPKIADFLDPKIIICPQL